MSYWVKFADREPACVSNDINAPKYGKVTSIESIPYPAFPCLDDPDTWTMCHNPELCKGKSNCPRDPVCSE